MNVGEIIRRFETLEPDSERRRLEAFLYGLTGITRLLYGQSQDPTVRMRILVCVSEIHHYVLKRVLALADGDKDTFFTVAHTWHSVQEYAVAVPALDEWVTRLADTISKTVRANPAAQPDSPRGAPPPAGQSRP